MVYIFISFFNTIKVKELTEHEKTIKVKETIEHKNRKTDCHSKGRIPVRNLKTNFWLQFASIIAWICNFSLNQSSG